MMKRRFTTITTILAGALAGNTAFFFNSGDCNTGNAAYSTGSGSVHDY